MNNNWDLSQERCFIEDLFCKTFNFFVVFFSLVIAGVLNARNHKLIAFVLAIGTVISVLLELRIFRIYNRVICILKNLHAADGHPVQFCGKEIDKMAWPFSIKSNWIIGVAVPLFCVFVLISLFVINLIPNWREFLFAKY